MRRSIFISAVRLVYVATTFVLFLLERPAFAGFTAWCLWGWEDNWISAKCWTQTSAFEIEQHDAKAATTYMVGLMSGAGTEQLFGLRQAFSFVHVSRHDTSCTYLTASSLVADRLTES
ncbi:hypothetical protein CLAFUW4_20005 [Fulvia fulva]|uniref:uncharacterized protein n=1 Tax=Passalora fulva TaxID=5499 RepID=UPI0028528BD4|nr:uncharacterized protein CLAFUR5_20005 [Fulvia fulva]KAK4636302.1 hypothetical protein CLAFUR4_20005 [Fulvia fulva]KAK4637208.1 hypothetical protein CLAFUR0_20005 [Fulvia fulva]WMI38755.1 hypothetical protein CLAFUR5_20005 [Fulvia fulva]WPV08514.1 hypothetical protein CLAFUW4_20005 [Fulvia fulva]WPV25075.1 hypothetical protein CLAFUW7_20005 [Fulvia fulva]